MRTSARTKGITLIELLVVMAIVGVVLAVLTAFFQTQVRSATRAQASNEVRAKIRSVAEVMVQDLQIAGSRAVYDGASVTYIDPVVSTEPTDTSSAEWAAWKATQCSAEHRDGCVQVNTGGVDLRIYYATSLDRGGGSACRRIDYLVDADGLLFRRDVDCDDTTTTFDGFDFASGVVSIDVEFICHDPDTSVPDIASCYTATTYPREASVTVTGTAESQRDPVQVTVNLATSLPNLRPPVDYLDL